MMSREHRDAIRQRLDEIASAHEGRITPELVVEDARDPESPLHNEFPWDLEKAAYQHWLDRARTIIRSVMVVTRTEKRTIVTPYFLRDPAAAQDEQGYRSIVSIRSDQDMARDALVDEFQRVAGLLRRARAIAVALQMEDDVDELLTTVVGLRERVQQQAPAQMQ